MAIYLDTSLLISAITVEVVTPRTVAWIENNVDGVISDWSLTEIASALALKVRMGVLSPADRLRAKRSFQRLSLGFDVVTVRSQDFSTAAEYIESVEVPLRASDALHLAVCTSAGVALATLDRRMAQAAAWLGIAVADI